MIDLPDGGTPRDDVVTSAQPFTARAVETIGPYRLLQRVGEGGMGEVWLAEQTQPVRRQVAVKVIKAGMDTAHVVARFEAERQALALMSHPSIAQVFDAGATPQGRPYFAMEYVRGEPITSYCNHHHLSTRQRIDLFLDVCEGVQHAHQKGVIHRDLKPSNVLVTEQGGSPLPKIIDFGVAKATTQPLTARTLYTELGAIIGTPEYMSPEQAEMTSVDVDTRTDVYALGVILYELLTDLLPFDAAQLRSKGLDEIRRTIREVDPPRPSTRVTATAALANTSSSRPLYGGATASELRGDLDWITLRALEKDRTRRYGSASDLAADLRRHLDNLPVLASPPSTTYRVQKFVRRHRIGVATGATGLLLLVTFAAAMAVQAQRVARERDRANVEAESARQVSEFLVGLFGVSDPNESRGNTVTAREILEKGAKEIEQQLAGQPLVQARLQTTIAHVYTNLGLYTAAEPLLLQALATAERIGAGVQALTTQHALANLYWFERRYGEAEPLYLTVLEERRRTLGEMHPNTLKTCFDLASLYYQQKRWDEAARLQRDTLERQRHVLGPEHPDTLSSLNNLAVIYWGQKRYIDAESPLKEVLAIRRRRLGSDHPDTLGTIGNLGVIEHELGRFADAEALLREALAGKQRVLGESHPSMLSTQTSLAQLYRQQERYAEAEPLATAAYRTAAAAYGSGNRRTQDAAKELVTLYSAWGKSDKAAEWRGRLPKEGATITDAR